MAQPNDVGGIDRSHRVRTFTIQVTEALVSGTVSCPTVPVLVDGEPAGTSSINLEFSAAS